MAADRVTVPGSERQLVPGHERVGDVETSEDVQVTVYLRPRGSLDWVDDEAARPLSERSLATRDEWADRYGADPDDAAAVTAFAQDHGLTIRNVDLARRAVTVHGSVASLVDAFGAQLAGQYAPSGGAPSYRARTGPLTVPGELEGIVVGVFGLDNRPQTRTQIRFAAQAETSYTPPQVAELYSFPSGATAAGQTVGVVELGGGYSTSDLSTYFEGLGLSAPTVTEVSVDGGTNSPGADQDADGEVMLDLEVIGGVAPGVAIAAYFSPNTDQGFIDAVSTAVHDTTNHPSVVSISWGESEDSWTSQARTQMEQILTEAAGLGVTVTVAAGDNGSTDGVSDGEQHVDFPASAPHALACGGTTLNGSGTDISSETVWNTSGDGSTGGGVSREFALPSYQTNAHVPDNVDTGSPGRGVPDVSGNADPATGYAIRVDGSDETVGGTSAVAPLWAGLTALLNEALGTPLGFAQPRLYQLLGKGGFHDITSGNNGSYSAGAGWDACTGLGSPDGSLLVSELPGTTAT
ncbi:MAG: S53 family peptidase [Solirubrobacteraceae bacterium]